MGKRQYHLVCKECGFVTRGKDKADTERRKQYHWREYHEQTHRRREREAVNV